MADALSAGERDRRVQLLSWSTDGDNGLEAGDAWTPAGWHWAKKVDVSDGERMRAQANGAVLTTRFSLLSTGVTRKIKAKDRLVCGGVTYDVTGIKDLGTLEGVEITAAAVREA